MDVCVVYKRKAEPTENWIKAHLWGGFAIFHWSSFGAFLRSGSEEQVASVVWKANSLAKTN